MVARPRGAMRCTDRSGSGHAARYGCGVGRSLDESYASAFSACRSFENCRIAQLASVMPKFSGVCRGTTSTVPVPRANIVRTRTWRVHTTREHRCRCGPAGMADRQMPRTLPGRQHRGRHRRRIPRQFVADPGLAGIVGSGMAVAIGAFIVLTRVGLRDRPSWRVRRNIVRNAVVKSPIFSF